MEAQADLAVLAAKRKAAEEEAEQLREELVELGVEKERIDVRAGRRGGGEMWGMRNEGLVGTQFATHGNMLLCCVAVLLSVA